MASHIHRYRQSRDMRGYVSMATDRAVTRPPKPWGPIPSRFTASSVTLHLGVIRVPFRAIQWTAEGPLANSAHNFKIAADPYAQDHGRTGIASRQSGRLTMKFRIVSRPAAGVSICNRLIFSLPKPLGATVSDRRSPEPAGYAAPRAYCPRYWSGAGDPHHGTAQPASP